MICSKISDEGDDENAVDIVRQCKANKRHTCCECDGLIAVGDFYTINEVLYDGSWSRHKTCEHCKALIDAFVDDYTVGELLYDLRGHFIESGGVYDFAAVDNLPTVARDRFFEIIEAVWAVINHKDDV